MSQEWLGITHYGIPVLDENNEHHPLWISGKIFLYEGYECKRTLSNVEETKKYFVINQVYKSTCGKPLFRTLTYKDENFETLLSCYNCKSTYSCYKKTLTRCDINIKGNINGNRFFGFTLSDYTKRPATTDSVDIDKDISDVIDPSHERISSWGDILEYGTPVPDDHRYIKTVGKIKCRLQPGFKVFRRMKVSPTKSVNLYLTIEKSTEGPLYRAFTENEEPKISISTNAPSEIKQVYDQLKIKCNKNWSAFEFFGFTRPDVLCVITCAYNTPSNTMNNSKTRKLNENIDNLMNIRHRNAGITSNLCNKAAKNRNEKVKDIVEYATFGDLKSEF